MEERVQKLLSDFKNERNRFKIYSRKLKKIIKDILDADKSIRVNEISSRVKEKSSFKNKIAKDFKYSSLSDVTDISGLRIICYFDSDIDKIAKLIENDFDVDYENSVDKRKAKDDSFGYKSLHFVVQLKENRLTLTEYSPFRGLKSEIQIRSILQHAWAEIEHDLGYKSSQSLPYEFRRAFSRVSALLETADIEFSKIKTDLESYVVDLPKLFEGDFSKINIDKDTLKYYVESSKFILKVARKIANDIGVPLDFEFNSEENLLGLINSSGIFTIEQLDKLLAKEEHYLSTHFIGYQKKNPRSSISGITIGFPIYQVLHKMHGQD